MDPVNVTPPVEKERSDHGMVNYCVSDSTHTNQNAKIRRDEMQSRYMSHIRQYAPDTRQHCGETDDRVQRSDHLRQLSRRDPSPNNRSDDPSNSSYTSELCEHFGREPNGKEGGQNT